MSEAMINLIRTTLIITAIIVGSLLIYNHFFDKSEPVNVIIHDNTWKQKYDLTADSLAELRKQIPYDSIIYKHDTTILYYNSLNGSERIKFFTEWLDKLDTIR